MTKNNFTINSFYIASILVVLFLVLISTTEASSVIRSGDTVSISENQVIEGDFYSAAGKVNVSGKIDDDMVSAGGQVSLNGSVGADAFIIGGQVDIYGSVGDDLRIFAGEVTIAETVVGDVFVMAGVVHILSTASITGDLMIFAGQATIEGSVGGDVLGVIDILRVDAPITGDIDIKVGQLTLGDQTEVDGSVSYVSELLVIQSLNATVVGELIRNDPVLPTRESLTGLATIPILILLFSVLVWYWISRNTLQKVVDRAILKVSIRPFLLGLATLVFVPIAVGLLMLSMIGGILALALMFAYLLLVILSLIGFTAVLGQLLVRTFSKSPRQLSLTALLIGVIGVALLLLLPVVGDIILVGFVTITLGAVVDLLIRPEIN
jgi:cytoskeletal protein CcmA (bactofilin family)